MQFYGFLILYKMFEMRKNDMLLIYLTNKKEELLIWYYLIWTPWTKPHGKVAFNPGMEKSSDYMDDKAVSTWDENFILPVGKEHEISSWVGWMNLGLGFGMNLIGI